MGGGGRDFIFQCGAEDVALALAGSRTARGSVIGHELFRSVLWRAAATDYGTFLAHLPRGGSVRGLDAAFIEDGYRYHTSFDGDASVASAKAMGDTVVDAVRRFDGLDDGPSADRGYAYFDVLGLVLVAYSARTARLLHAAAGALGVALASRPPRAAAAAARTAAAVAAAALAGAAYGLVLAAAAPMRWYAGGPPAALALFLPPALIAFAELAPAPASASRGGALALWGGLALAAAGLDLGSGYAALAAVAALAVGAGPAALALWLQISRTLLTIAVPLLGRVGSRFPLDPALGALVGLLAGLGATLCGGRWAPLGRRRAAALLGLSTCVARSLGAYAPERPKRLTIQHARRSIDGVEDAGLWVLPLDGQRLRPLFGAVPDLALRPPPEADRAGPACYLEMPWFFPFCDIVRGDAYLPAPPPPLLNPATLIAERAAGGGVVLRIAGPSRMHVVVRGPITGWRFDGVDQTPPPRLRAEGVYLAQLTGGACRDACAYGLTLDVADGDRVDVALAAHHLSVADTPSIAALVADLPAWARGAYWGKFASELLVLHGV